MTDNKRTVVKCLAEICKIDAGLSSVLAERKRYEKEHNEAETKLKKFHSEHDFKAKHLSDLRLRYQREEKQLKEEAQRLSTRRMALGTLGNRKSIEKAEQEITFASRQIESREETMLSELDVLEKLEKEVSALKASEKAAQEDLLKLRDDIRAANIHLEKRESDYRSRRAELASNIDESSLSIYERTRERYAGDAVTAVSNGTCASCFMQVAPQLVVQIAQAQSIVKCRGCGRILYIDDVK